MKKYATNKQYLFLKINEVKIPSNHVTIDTSENGFLGSGGYGKVLIGKTAALGTVAVKAIEMAGQRWEIKDKYEK